MKVKKEKSLVLQHFQADEKIFAEKMMDRIDQVERQYRLELTSFLNPREVCIVESLVRHRGLQVFNSHQFMPTEFNRLIIAPDYYQVDESDFEIAVLEAHYSGKFHRLTHSQILGGLLNQLGIQRYLLGDIILSDERTQIVLDAKISELVVRDVTKLSRIPVTWELISKTDLVRTNQPKMTEQVLTSSMRLDRLIACVYRLSRQEAVTLIEQNRVKLNYQLRNQPSYLVKRGDLVSCRGLGRFKLTEEAGLTRSGKYKVIITKIGGK